MDSTYLIENFFLNLKKETAARLNIMMSHQELIKAIKDNSMCIEKTCLNQHHWHAFYPLIAENKWKVVDSEWADTLYHYNHAPIFLNVELYKEWVQDKESYNKNHPNTRFDEDSLGYDGMGDIVYCSQYFNFKKESMYVKDGYLADDCIAIKIYKSGNTYDICTSDSSSCSATQRKLRATFILQPTNKTKKERQEVIIEMFRDIITYRLATIKVQKYIDNLVPKLAKEISNT